MENKYKRVDNDVLKVSSNYKSFITNNTQPKHSKQSSNINSLLNKPTPMKKQIPKKSLTTNIHNNNLSNMSTNKPTPSTKELIHIGKLNLSKQLTHNENSNSNLDKAISHRVSSALSGTYKRTPTKYMENPLLSKIVKNNSIKNELNSLNKDKTLDTNKVSYTKLAMKKSENIIKSEGLKVQEIYQRFGKQTNYSKYKHFTKPKNSSMIIDTNNMLDSDTVSLQIANNNSLLFNKNKSDLADEQRVKQSGRRNTGSALDQVIEEENYRFKMSAKRQLTGRDTERISEILNFSVSSSIPNLTKEDEISLRFSKSRNGESLGKLKVTTENKVSRFRDSHSFIDESINLTNRDGFKCNTTRVLDQAHQNKQYFNNEINGNIELTKFDPQIHFGSEIFDLNENKKSKVSTKEDTIKSTSNRNDIETIEEQHFMFVKFLHSTKKMVKIQEENNYFKVHKNSTSQREVYPIEEIDLE